MLSFVSGLRRVDAMAAHSEYNDFSRWMNRLLLCGMVLFALSIPHSIAAAQISLGPSYIAWIARALATGRLRFTRTSIDRPLLCFIALTVASALFSMEPGESLPKLRSLTLFGVFYLVVANLHPRGVRLMAGLMIVSGLVGVGYSLVEKSWGRGMIITSVEPDSPLRTSQLQAGDVIWMIGRHRTNSLADALRITHLIPAGKTIDVEAVRAGDPLPATLVVTDELKSRSNPLGISVDGRSRRFRVSGFSRHFITYAEQMQLLVLLAYGLLLRSLKSPRRQHSRAWLFVSLTLVSLFYLALILTASRAVIVSCALALIMIPILMKESRAALVIFAAVVAIASLSVYVLAVTRTPDVASFTDDSSERRLGYMRAGLRLIPRHPILGVGMDAQKRHWKEWGFPGDYITHTHSTPIQVALDRGLPALGCYLWLMGIMFLMTWRGYNQALLTNNSSSSGLMLGAFAALTGFSASSLVNYNFGDSEVLLMLLFVVALAVVAGAKAESRG